MRRGTGLVNVAASVAGLALAGVLANGAMNVTQASATGPVDRTSTGSIDVSRYGVVRSSTLPHCKEEDGSGPQSLPCTWNIPTTGKPFHLDGNGVGLSYWIGVHRHIHYVWPDQMLGTPVEKIPSLEDALAEGERTHWRKCWLDENRTHVACPNGYRVRVYGQRAGSRSGAW